MHSFVQDSRSFINIEKLHLTSQVTGMVTREAPLALQVTESDPYLHLPWHHYAEQHQYSSCTLYFRIFFSKHPAMQSLCRRSTEVSSMIPSTWWSYEASASLPISPDPTADVFPNLISLQYFQLGYFYFFSCPVKSEGLLCWRKCVSPLQCWMNGACTWPNFLIWVVKINSKIITHVPKYCTGYRDQSTQLWMGMH